jgi:hypothetical protein
MMSLNTLILTTSPPGDRFGWVQVKFNSDGRVTGNIFPRYSRYVNTRSFAESFTIVRLPESGPNAVELTVRYRVSCPLHGEEDVARFLFSASETPQTVLDRIIRTALKEYVASFGESKLVGALLRRDEFEAHLSGRIQSATRLTVEHLTIELSKTPSPSIHVEFASQPFDFADNCRGLPVTLSLDLDVNNNDLQQFLLALKNIGKESALKDAVSEICQTVFRRVSLHRISHELDSVESDLRAALTSEMARCGRTVSRLVMAVDWSVLRPRQVEGEFSCHLADGSTLRLTVHGELWIVNTGRAVNRSDWQRGDDPWPGLLQWLTLRAGEILRPRRYAEIEADRQGVINSILSSIQDESNRAGLRTSLSIRMESACEWAIKGFDLNLEVEGAAGREQAPAKLWVSGKARLRADALLPAALTRAQAETDIHSAIEQAVRSQFVLAKLGEYFPFEAVEQKFHQQIASSVSGSTCFEFTDIRLQRLDDLWAQRMLTLLGDAPEFEVQHPRSRASIYRGRFRVTGAVADSGASIQVFPGSMEQVSAAVKSGILDVLSRNPVVAAGDLGQQRVLRKSIETEVPALIARHHFLRIEIVNWYPVGSTADTVLQELWNRMLDQLASNETDTGTKVQLRAAIAEMLPEARDSGVVIHPLKLRLLGVSTEALRQIEAADASADTTTQQQSAGAGTS